MEREKRIEIDDRFGKEFKGVYVFRTISWAESNRISGECTKIIPQTKRSLIDLKRMQALMVDSTLKERPEALTLQVLLGEDPKVLMPPVLGEILISATDLVNGYSEKDREELKNLKKRWGLE